VFSKNSIQKVAPGKKEHLFGNSSSAASVCLIRYIKGRAANSLSWI